MLLKCICGATNRIPSLPKKKVRCGKCQHTFTPQELMKAKPEPPPARPSLADLEDEFELESEDDDLEIEDNDD